VPQWDFKCEQCGHQETLTFPSFEKIEAPLCPKCDFWYDDPVKMERQPCAPGVFVLKGAGFHKNDYPTK